MDKEAEPVIDKIIIRTDEIIFGKRVVTGELYGEQTAVVICGVGKANAACGTQFAIDKLGADTVINVGVAGGLNPSVRIGEIYSVSEAVQYDFDLTQLNGTKIGTLDECSENYLPLDICPDFPTRRLATGDRFNDSKDDFLLLTKVLEADIRDMEGGAVAQVCMHAGVRCFIYKIISDLAGSGSTTEQYKENLALCFKTLEGQLKTITESKNG